MKTKLIVFAIGLAFLFPVISLISFAGKAADRSERTAGGSNSVPHTREELDLKQIVAGTDYVFSGTLLSVKDYEVTWTDSRGNRHGPYINCVIDVSVNKDLFGASPVSGALIQIFCPCSSGIVFTESAVLKEGSDYVFVTQTFDEAFIAQTSPEDKYHPEQHADVQITDTFYCLLPIDNGFVFMPQDYFRHDQAVMQHIRPVRSQPTDLLNPAAAASAEYCALSVAHFDDAFPKLFENPAR